MKYDTSKLKPFDLERAKAGDPVCTREGNPVRIVCVDTKGIFNQPILALIDIGQIEEVKRYHENGAEGADRKHIECDLMMAPKTVTKWVNVYKDKNETYVTSTTFDTLEQAVYNKYDNSHYFKTAKIEWEE